MRFSFKRKFNNSGFIEGLRDCKKFPNHHGNQKLKLDDDVGGRVKLNGKTFTECQGYWLGKNVQK